MRKFQNIILSFFFSLFLLPQAGFADIGDGSDPFSKFKNRVQAVKSLAGGADQWNSIAKTLSSNPLFSSLGLDKLDYSGGNQLDYAFELTLGDADLDLQGTLTFNTDLNSGGPVASLTAKTKSLMSGNDLFDVGALRARSADLDVVIYNEGGSYKIYARVIPHFTNYNKDPVPCLMLSKTKSGLDFTLIGGDLALKDIVPPAGRIPVYNRFTFASLSRTGTVMTIQGAVSGRDVVVTADTAKKIYSVTGNALVLSDFIPDASNLPALNNFAFTGFSQAENVISVSGTVGGKKVSVSKDLDQNSFTVTGDSLKLADFISDAAKIPVLNNFAFVSLIRTPSSITVNGTVGGKNVTAASDSSGQNLSVTGDSLRLRDFVPETAAFPFLNNFSFKSLSRTPNGFQVTGGVNAAEVAVARDFGAQSFSVTGTGLKLSDFVPAASNVPALDNFVFVSLLHTPGAAQVSGTISGKSVVVAANSAAGTFAVTGENLLLKDFIPAAANVPFLKAFAFDSFNYSPSSVEAAGKVNSKAVSVQKMLNSPNFSITGDDLKLMDFIPETAQVPCVNAFALDSVQRSDLELDITGKVNGRPVAISDSFADNTFKMTGLGLSLPSCIPLSINIPFLNFFNFGSLFHWPDRIEVDGTVNGKAVKIIWFFTKGVLTVTGDSLELADFIPAAANIPVLNKFAFSSLTYSNSSLQVDGTVNGKNVSVVQDNVQKTVTITGSALQLADFVPETAKIPYLQKFDLNMVRQSPDGVQVTGDVDGKSVAVDSNRTTGVFKVTGNSLVLADFIPEASGVAFLNNFAFQSLTVSSGKWAVAGTINSKAVAVKKDGGASGFSVTGDDIKLADLVPDAAGIPFLSTFAFDSMVYTPAATTVTGKVGAKSVSIVKNAAEESFTLTGSGIVLADFVPASSQVPFLNAFAFDRLKHSAGKLEVTGEINGISVTVKKDLSQQSFEVISEDLTLADFIPDAAKVPLLNKFSFDSLLYTPQNTTVNGKINAKAVSVVLNPADKTFKVTGADLKLADFVPEAGSVPFLSAFAFDSLSYSAASIIVDGKINAKKVSVTKAFGPAGVFTAAGEGLTLKDIVPEAGGIKAFDALALNLVSVSPAAVQVDGTINGKAVRFVRTRGAAPVSTITADGMVLADLFAPLAGVPAVNSVAVDKISLDGASVEVEAKLNGTTVDVVSHANQGTDGAYVAVFFDSLGAATFIPAAQGHVVNDLSLEKALFIIQPAGSPARTVKAADLPGDLPKLSGWSGSDSMNLSEGVNFYAQVNVAKSGGLANALKTVGIPAGSLPIKGTVSPSTFKGMTGQTKGSPASLPDADKQSILSGLKLSIDLPLPALPAIAGLVTVKGPVKLSIGGDAKSKSSLWSRVPAALASSKPSGDLDVSVQFEVDIVGADINEKLDALISMDKGTRGGLTLLALYDGVWKDPFGISGFTLADGGFEFSLEGAGAAKTQDLAFFATAEIGSKDVSVTADLKRADGKISLNYFELDGKFKLGDFPGGKSIPNAEQFELDMVKLSVNGIEAKTVISGKKVDAFLFNAGTPGAANWIFAVDQKNFKITELIPAAKNIKPLAAMTIPNAALIISQNGLKVSDRNALGVIAKDLFDEIFGKANVPVNIPSGIGLLAGFDANAMGLVGKGLGKIGVHDDAIIMGAVTGVFQGTPGVMLELAMESAGTTKGLPNKVMNFKDGVQPAFFIQWAGEDLYAGLSIAMAVKAGKETLILDSKLELEFTETGVGVKILGEMDGIWHQPFGIKGFNLANVKMDVGIDDIGNVQFGLAGDQQYGNCAIPSASECVDVDLAMSVKLLVEDALPDGVAFAGKVNQLSVPALVEIAETLMGKPGQIAKLPVPYFQINNAQMAYATPGAADPQLGLVSEGFAFAGTFVFMNQELGKVQGSGGPTSGVTLKGAIADIDLDVLQFRNNSVDFAINLDPRYCIDSTVDLLGAQQKVKLDIKPPYFEFDLTEKLGAFGDADMTIRLDGFDLQKGTFDKNAGISVVGEFKSTLVPWLKGEIKKGIEELRDSAKAKFEADNQALKDAQKKVDDLNDQIQKLKAQDQKAKDRADAVLDSARNRVSSLRDKHDHEMDKAHHCGSRWTHWACSPGWRTAAAATWVVLEVAEDALKAAEKVVAAATDLDPRIAVLIAARDVEHAGLSVAQAVVKVTEDIEDFVMKDLENVLEKAMSDLPFEVDKAVIVGDLRDMITHNDPLVLDMQFKIAGDPMHEYFAVKIPDRPENLEFDAVSFSLLPALGMDKLTEDALKKISADAARWVHSHIAANLADAEEKVREEVSVDEEKYKDVLATFDNGTAKYKKAFEDQSDDQQKIVEQMDVTDLMPDSLEYQGIYLAIGHSNLCLAVSKDGMSVVQIPCKDTDVEQWNTVKLTGDDDKGYVQLKNKGLCLKARNGDQTDNFEPLVLSQCDSDDRHEQWKVLSTDGFYDQIVNRSSQKCLHFNTEDANPQSAFAVWTACLGPDSQTFRDITDAEKPTWHPVQSMVKASNGLCLDIVEETENSLKVTPEKKDIKLYAHQCGDGSEKFNYLEEVDGDIRLVHDETGFCIYPQANSNSLALRACDRGEDMFWRLNPKTDTYDQFFNPSRNSCMILPAPPQGSTRDVEAGLANCGTVPNDGLLLDFTK